jgi:hypothetical protein
LRRNCVATASQLRRNIIANQIETTFRKTNIFFLNLKTQRLQSTHKTQVEEEGKVTYLTLSEETADYSHETAQKAKNRVRLGDIYACKVNSLKGFDVLWEEGEGAKLR